MYITYVSNVECAGVALRMWINIVARLIVIEDLKVPGTGHIIELTGI